MLALACVISAAVCINKIVPANVYSILEQSSYSSLGYALNNKLHLTNAEIQLIKIDLPMRTQSAAGWIIFLLIVVLLYQTFAVVQLFLYIPPLYMKIPIRKTFWYLFPLIVCLVTIFSTLCDHNYVNPYLIECCGQYNLYDWISTSYRNFPTSCNGYCKKREVL